MLVWKLNKKSFFYQNPPAGLRLNLLLPWGQTSWCLEVKPPATPRSDRLSPAGSKLVWGLSYTWSENQTDLFWLFFRKRTIIDTLTQRCFAAVRGQKPSDLINQQTFYQNWTQSRFILNAWRLWNVSSSLLIFFQLHSQEQKPVSGGELFPGQTGWKKTRERLETVPRARNWILRVLYFGGTLKSLQDLSVGIVLVSECIQLGLWRTQDFSL